MKGRFSVVTALGLSLIASNGPLCRQVQEPKEVCVLCSKKMENVPRDPPLEKIKVKLSHKATPWDCGGNYRLDNIFGHVGSVLANPEP